MSRRQDERQDERHEARATHDPLRLCVLTTAALLTWLLGPVVVAGLALLGFLGYRRARADGVTTSRCILRDTRLVLAYLGVVGLVALGGAALQLRGLLS